MKRTQKRRDSRFYFSMYHISSLYVCSGHAFLFQFDMTGHTHSKSLMRMTSTVTLIKGYV